MKTIHGDPSALYQYVIKCLASEILNEEQFFGDTDSTRSSYLRYINTAVKRNHDRIVKLTL